MEQSEQVIQLAMQVRGQQVEGMQLQPRLWAKETKDPSGEVLAVHLSHDPPLLRSTKQVKIKKFIRVR